MRLDTHAALASSLIELLLPAEVRIMSSSETPWASITFSGARHRFVMLVSGDKANSAVRDMERNIGNAEFNIRNQLVADVSVSAPECDARLMRIEVEAITVEAA
jgi:hypothetical protein